MQEKKCRKCKCDLEIKYFPRMNMWKYWVWSTCNDCLQDNVKHYEIKRTPLKPSMVKINKVSKTNKNIPAKFSSKVKAQILIRDKCCIFKWCWKPIQDYHHVFFSQQAEYWEDRNDANKWVWSCRECHNWEWWCHWCKSWEWKRQEAIDYVKIKEKE